MWLLQHSSLIMFLLGEPKINYLFDALLQSMQLLDTGFFHADPHPGNLIRTPDGKLAILDFGNVLDLGNDLVDLIISARVTMRPICTMFNKISVWYT